MSYVTLLFYGAFLGYFLVVNGIGLLFLFLALREHRRSLVENLDSSSTNNVGLDDLDAISVIVPAFNEEAVIVQTVSSILRSDHPRFEVVVINDGSVDSTLDVLKREFDLEALPEVIPGPLQTASVRCVYQSRAAPNLRVVDKENGGGADAANAGLNLARHPYFLHSDADCIFEPATLVRVARHLSLSPETTIGLGGQVRPSNGLEIQKGRIVGSQIPRGLFVRFQMIEYVNSFLINRIGLSRLNAVGVLTGAFSAWRRSTIIELGGYATDVTHGDIELTLRAHRHFLLEREQYRLPIICDATIWTQAPANLWDLCVQRKRWQRVVYEVVWKYRSMLFNPRFGTVGVVTLPSLLLISLGPFIETAAYSTLASLAFLGTVHTGLLMLFLAFSFGLGAVVSMSGLLIDAAYFRTYGRRSIAKLGLAVLLAPFLYQPAQLGPRMYAFYEFLSGKRSHEKLRRM